MSTIASYSYLDDGAVVVPEYIRKMTSEERKAEIEKLEKEEKEKKEKDQKLIAVI